MANITLIPNQPTIDLTEPRALAVGQIGVKSAYYVEFYIVPEQGQSYYEIIYFESETTFNLPSEFPVYGPASPRTAWCQVSYTGASWYVSGQSIGGDWTYSTVIDALGVGATYYLAEQTIPITYNGEEYDPIPVDDLYFNKQPLEYKINVGVAANSKSRYNDYYYISRPYNIVLRWTSLKTGTQYRYPLTNLVSYTPAVLTPTLLIIGYSFNYLKTNDDTVSALRMPLGFYTNEQDIPTDYDALTDLRSFNQIPLQTLIDYMQTQTAGATEQDIFTEIFADFIVNDDVVKTMSVDYSSIYGEEIDVNAGTVSDPNAADGIPDTNIYTDNIPLTVPTLTATGVFNRCYSMDGNSVNDLCDFLYNADDNIFSEIIDGVLTRGNPIDSIIDLRLYPFDVQQFTGGGTAEFIKFGRTVTTVIGSKLPHDANAVISLGSCVIPRVYDNFLDYQMDISLYIPFCGVVSLPTDRVLNHTVSIKLIVDYITGACTAVVYVDNIPLLYQSGVIGVSVPMTATNSADFANSIIGNLITGVGQAVEGNVKGIAATALDTASALYEGSKLQTAGTTSPQTSLYQPKNAYILLSIVNPPEGVYNDTYGNLIGYACFMPVAMINYVTGAGFVAFDNIKLDIPQATEQEKADIINLLRSGVYL